MLQNLNKQMSMQGTQSLLIEWEQANALMTMKQEVTDDILEDTFKTDNEQAETEELIVDIMKEAGLNLDLMTTSKKDIIPPDSDLESRLKALKST